MKGFYAWDKKSLRTLYLMLYGIQKEMLRYAEKDFEYSKLERLRVHLVKGIREYLNKEERPVESKTYFARDYYGGVDGGIEKLTFREGVKPSEARCYFALHEYIPHPAPSPYDCTGEIWTARFKTTTLHGRTVIYHWIAVDL